MRRPCGCLAPTAFLAVALATAPARGEGLVADLSEHLIAITTAFVGTDVVLFGTSDGGADIVVTVVGPRQNQIVRRKGQIAGIWVNRESLEFERVPTYYAVATSAPLDQIARADVLARHELGIEHLRLEPVDAAGLAESHIDAFREALVRNKQRQRLYSSAPPPVSFLGPSLFRTTLSFPANVPPGIYQVQVFELEDGYVKDAQRSALVISKVGLEADLFDFAQQRAPLYGLLAIVMAVSLGWLAGVIFRRS
ncbi:MAG TPA: TIGR02186 family protein [Geminicoccaceae bacterium]|nr:TIGR02186 family protein [Geminicoccaceae bacterium]